MQRRIIDSRYVIYAMAACISMVLSYWIDHQIILLNPDAICYLQSAQMVSHGLSSAMSLCDQSQWPFYSILIAGFVKITTLSYESAALTLNSLFSLFTVLVFMRIVALFSDNKRILWLAAFVILFAHEYNALKEEIIRDHGFWLFYLLSIFFLLQYITQKKVVYAVGFSSSLIVATLFRIEGAIFLLCMPWLIWFDYKESLLARLKSFLYLNSSMVCMAAILLVIVILHPAMSLGRLHELFTHFQPSHFYFSVIKHYITLANGLGDVVLGRSAHDKYLIYFFTLVVWYCSIVISALSLIYAVLFVYALTKKLLPLNKNAALVLLGYILINVVMTFIFLVESQFLSKRYVYALAFTLMIWIPFALDHLIKLHKKQLTILVMFAMALYGVSSLFHFGHSKQYVRDAGNWLAHVPIAATIYTNDYQLMYYSHHFGNDIFVKQREFSDINRLKDGKWKQYDYVALRLNKDMVTAQMALLQELDHDAVVVFNSSHNEDQVRIYRRSQS